MESLPLETRDATPGFRQLLFVMERGFTEALRVQYSGVGCRHQYLKEF